MPHKKKSRYGHAVGLFGIGNAEKKPGEATGDEESKFEKPEVQKKAEYRVMMQQLPKDAPARKAWEESERRSKETKRYGASSNPASRQQKVARY